MKKTGAAIASVNGTVIAQTPRWEEVDGNVYFPPGTHNAAYFSETEHHTTCPWKGQASYYTIQTEDGTTLENAAWVYPETKEEADHIKDHIAFYKTKVKIQVEYAVRDADANDDD